MEGQALLPAAPVGLLASVVFSDVRVLHPLLLLRAEQGLDDRPQRATVDRLPAVRLAARSVEDLAVGLLDGFDEGEAALRIERVGVEHPWLAAIGCFDPWLDRLAEPGHGEGAVAPSLVLEMHLHIWMVEMFFLLEHRALTPEDESHLTYSMYMYMYMYIRVYIS
jgi:hypothetical protein